MCTFWSSLWMNLYMYTLSKLQYDGWCLTFSLFQQKKIINQRDPPIWRYQWGRMHIHHLKNKKEDFQSVAKSINFFKFVAFYDYSKIAIFSWWFPCWVECRHFNGGLDIDCLWHIRALLLWEFHWFSEDMTWINFIAGPLCLFCCLHPRVKAYKSVLSWYNMMVKYFTA